MPGLGKIQRRIKRAFTASPGARLTTMDLARWSYPRQKAAVLMDNRLSIRRAAEAVAVKIGRTYPGGTIWVGKENALSGDKSQMLPSDDDRE
jgi:hypothetical protein